MSTPNGMTTLPQEVADALASQYEAYTRAVSERSPERETLATNLANFAARGHDAGWSFRAMATPCGITPERLRQIVKEKGNGSAPTVDLIFPIYEAQRKEPSEPKRKRVHLTEEQALKLRELAPEAKKNSGSKSLDSPARKASEEFSDLIMMHHDQGVTWREMSDATRNWSAWPIPADEQKALMALDEEQPNHPLLPTHRAIGLRMRAARHGYGKGAPPSIQPYRRIALYGDSNESAEDA